MGECTFSAFCQEKSVPGFSQSSPNPSYTNRKRKETTMTETTYRAIKAVLDSDLTLDASRKRAVLNALTGEAPEGRKGGREPPNKILKGVEVAKLLGVCRKTVQNWRTRGLLVPFKTGRNATGYLERDVLAFQERFRDVPQAVSAI